MENNRDFNILIVDDSIPTRQALYMMLRKLGILKIDQAGNGVQAIEKLQDTVFDLIITDVSMPKFSGIDLLRSLRTSKSKAKQVLPVLMISASNDKDILMQAIKFGVNGYLLKPFSGKDLVMKINEIIPGVIKPLESSSSNEEKAENN